MSDTNDNTPAPEALQHIAQQVAIVQMAQRITRETFTAMTSEPSSTEQSNALAAQALEVLAPNGGLRMVTMCATAAVVASVVQGVIMTDLEQDRKALPSDALIMSICMMAQHLMQSHQTRMALNAAVEADPARAN